MAPSKQANPTRGLVERDKMIATVTIEDLGIALQAFSQAAPSFFQGRSEV